jgi:hypothetical protein
MTVVDQDLTMNFRIYSKPVTFASINVGQQFIPKGGGLCYKVTSRTADLCLLTHKKRVYFKQADIVYIY